MPRLRNKLVCLALLIGGSVALGQAITPPIAEFRGFKAEGSFEIDNQTEQAMSVVLQTRSFSVSNEGRVVYQPLQSSVRLEIGASSFIIPSHDSHTVYYKAASTVSPASFSIIPTMTPLGRTTGLRIGYTIPHMIYLYQKVKLVRSDVQLTRNGGTLTIRNLSGKLGRVEFIHNGNNDLDGFPIYPEQTRQIPITDANTVVEFEEGFKIEAQ
jgi:hypothetical protein